MRTLLLTVLLALTGCTSTPASGTDAGEVLRIPVTLDANGGQIVFQAEIADTPEDRTRGLMFREKMGESEGMLFLFPREAQLSFWMRNTLIPLDIIFIKSDQTVLGVAENAVPKTDTPRQVPGLSQFVLEINAGGAAKAGIVPGTRVTFMAPLPTR